jgi:hypothetical protein
MGAGKGNVEYWIAKVQPGKVLFEMEGVTEAQARTANLLPASGQGFVVRQATVTQANFNGTANISLTDGYSMEVVSVPEPSTWVMGLMAAGVALARRRRLAGLLTRLRRSIPL